MVAIILLSLGLIVCLTVIILLIRFIEEAGCGIIFIPLIIGVILFISLKNKWTSFRRYEGTSIENCSDLLNIDKFPNNKSRGILMLTIDTCLHGEVDACVKLSNGDSLRIESAGGVLAVVLPTGTGVFDYIKFNYGPGLNMSYPFRSYSYSQVEFKQDFTIKEGKLTYLGHITRKLNPDRFNVNYNSDFNLFHYTDNTYLYSIIPETDNPGVIQLLAPWRDAGRLFGYRDMLYDKFFQLLKH